MSRKVLAMVVSAMLLLVILSACGTNSQTNDTTQAATTQAQPTTSATQATENKQPQKIVMFAADQPDVIDPIKDNLENFKNETGIEVKVETVPESQRTTKANLILSSGSSDYDVFVSASNDLPGNVQAKWYAPINNLLPKDFDYSDFPQQLVGLLTIDGNTYGLPTRAETNILMYRKDLFEKYSITVPKNMDEYLAAAKKLTVDTDKDGKVDLYGTALRGDPGQSGYTFTYFLKTMGGHFFDKDMKPVINSPEAIKGLELYTELDTKCAPQGATVYTWDQVFGAVQTGKSAMIIESSIQAGILEDPNKSNVVGKMAYDVPPAGPAGAKPDLKCYGYSISSFSKNMEASAQFIQWATGKDIQKYAFDKYGVAALTRNSVLDYAYTKAPYFKAIKDSMAVGDTQYLPLIPELGSVYTATCEAVSSALAGTASVQDALKKANDKIKKAIDDAGYSAGSKEIPQFIKDGRG